MRRKYGIPAKLICHGGVATNTMLELLHTVDLLFMPSVKKAVGLCIMDAMAPGPPVFAICTCALPELTKEGKEKLYVKLMMSAHFLRQWKPLQVKARYVAIRVVATGLK